LRDCDGRRGVCDLRVGIGFLNSAQRSLAVQDLALAEANDAVEYRDDGIDETTQEDRPESVREGEGEATPEIVAPAAVGPSPAPDLLSKVGDGRIANFGCPHCGGYEVGRWGRANGRPRYRCKECRKTFGPLTGTPLAGLHYKDRWMDQAQALMSGESVVKAAERCAINRTTAFRWRHRFLSALNLDKPTSLSGIVEADETFVLESFKGKRNRSWNSLAPERRTPEAMDIMAAVIVHLATQG
jgi:transposase-like protein